MSLTLSAEIDRRNREPTVIAEARRLAERLRATACVLGLALDGLDAGTVALVVKSFRLTGAHDRPWTKNAHPIGP